MKNKGTIWIITGLLLITAALCLTLYNVYEDIKASQTAGEIMDELFPEVTENRDETHITSTIVPEADGSVPEMPVKVIDGNEYIAIISIPSLDIELPVHSTWDYTKLQSAPCRYYGSVYTNDFVICAHNYRSHFGPIRRLSIGDSVTVIDMDGNVFNYSVVEVETLYPSTDEMLNDDDDWDLTLFTCTLGGATRVTVRCVRTD